MAVLFFVYLVGLVFGLLLACAVISEGLDKGRFVRGSRLAVAVVLVLTFFFTMVFWFVPVGRAMYDWLGEHVPED